MVYLHYLHNDCDSNLSDIDKEKRNNNRIKGIKASNKFHKLCGTCLLCLFIPIIIGTVYLFDYMNDDWEKEHYQAHVHDVDADYMLWKESTAAVHFSGEPFRCCSLEEPKVCTDIDLDTSTSACEFNLNSEISGPCDNGEHCCKTEKCGILQTTHGCGEKAAVDYCADFKEHHLMYVRCEQYCIKSVIVMDIYDDTGNVMDSLVDVKTCEYGQSEECFQKLVSNWNKTWVHGWIHNNNGETWVFDKPKKENYEENYSYPAGIVILSILLVLTSLVITVFLICGISGTYYDYMRDIDELKWRIENGKTLRERIDRKNNLQNTVEKRTIQLKGIPGLYARSGISQVREKDQKMNEVLRRQKELELEVKRGHDERQRLESMLKRKDEEKEEYIDPEVPPV